MEFHDFLPVLLSMPEKISFYADMDIFTIFAYAIFRCSGKNPTLLPASRPVPESATFPVFCHLWYRFPPRIVPKSATYKVTPSTVFCHVWYRFPPRMVPFPATYGTAFCHLKEPKILYFPVFFRSPNSIQFNCCITMQFYSVCPSSDRQNEIHRILLPRIF